MIVASRAGMTRDVSCRHTRPLIRLVSPDSRRAARENAITLAYSSTLIDPHT